MSAKITDRHNRHRSITVGFRVSPEENEQINRAVAVSGLPKQEYCYRRCLDREITVLPNPRVYKALKTLLTEVLGVATLNFLGLWLIAKIGFYPALGIAFITGLLNVIPYVGPWIGAAIGVVLGLILKFSSAAALGIFPNFWVIAITLLAIFAFTQMVDNFFFQPFIYSTSIKSSPLEIFIVLLIAGHVGGIIGMLVAIPSYTVIRVIAARFLKGAKPVRRLIEATSDEAPADPNITE